MPWPGTITASLYHAGWSNAGYCTINCLPYGTGANAAWIGSFAEFCNIAFWDSCGYWAQWVDLGAGAVVNVGIQVQMVNGNTTWTGSQTAGAIPASWTSVTVIADMALSFGWIPTDAGQYLVANLSASNPAPTNYVNFGRTGSNSRGPFRGTIPILARWTVTSLTQIQIVLRVTVGGGGVDAGLYRIGGSLRAFPT
jgi:hypothetical protein